MVTDVKRVEKPWGHEVIWARADRYVGKILHINSGHSLSYQYHRVKDETIHVLRGVLDLEIGTADGHRSLVRLVPGQSFHIRPQQRHRMSAVEDCEVLEASTPELDDVVRLEDRYGRASPGSQS